MKNLTVFKLGFTINNNVECRPPYLTAYLMPNSTPAQIIFGK